MTRNNKILLGIASFIPIIAFIIGMGAYISFIFTMMDGAVSNGNNPPFADHPSELFKTILPAMAGIFLASIVGIALFIYFIICAIKDKSASENDQILWVLLLVFLSYFIFPVYWFFRIWKNENFSLTEAPSTEL